MTTFIEHKRAPAMRRIRLALFTICGFLFVCVYWMVASYLPLHLKDLGMPDPTIGTITGMYSISTLALMLPLGFLADRISPKRILIAGAVLLWTHILGMLAARTTWHFMLLSASGGMGYAIFQIVLFALLLKVTDDKNRSMVIAVFHAGLFLGFGVGPYLGGILWDHADFDTLLRVAMAWGILLNVCVLGLLDSSPISFELKGYKEDLSQPRAIMLLGIYFLFATHYGVEQTAHTLLMREDLSFTGHQIGLTFLAVGIWMGLLAPLTGRQFDTRQGLFQLLTFGLIMSAIFQMWTAWVQTLTGMLIVRLFHTLGDTPVIMAMGIMTAAFFPRGRMGGNSAVVYGVRTLGSFAGSIMAGIIAPLVGYGGTFVYNGFFLLIVSVCLIPLMQRRLALVASGE